MEVERGCEQEGVPCKMFTTSKATLERSSELSIEVDGVVVRLVPLEEGPGSFMKTRHYYLSIRPLVTKGKGACMVFKLAYAYVCLQQYIIEIHNITRLPSKYKDNRGRLAPTII